MIILRYTDTEPRREWLSPRGHLLAKNIGTALLQRRQLNSKSVIVTSPEPAAVMTAMTIANFVPFIPVVRTLPELQGSALHRHVATFGEDGGRIAYGVQLGAVLVDMQQSVESSGSLVVVSSASAIESLVAVIPSAGEAPEMEALRSQAGWISELSIDPLTFTGLQRVHATR